MGNKVKFTMKNAPVGLSQINSAVLDTNYNKLWSGTSPVSGADVEIDLGAIGTVGQNVWVYCNNAQTGSEDVSKVMGGYSSIDLDTEWYSITTGMITCSNDLLECNSEVIPCL